MRESIFFGLSLFLAGCGCGGDDGGGSVCEPGRSIECACPGGDTGAQSCNADGQGYSQCDCGGGDADADTDADSDADTDADTDTDSDTDSETEVPPCDPVAQTGCEAGEKCSWRADESGDPSAGATECVPDGAAALGAACAGYDEEGYDNCVAGSVCVNAECAEICTSSPDSCSGSVACNTFSWLFADLTNIGACVATCDPLSQDCFDASDGCFLNPTIGAGFCDVADETGTQGQDCTYSNDCAEGYGCLVMADPSSSQPECTAFCDAVDDDPSCVDSVGPTYSCYALPDIYPEYDAVPPEIGVCLDPLVWPDL